MSIFLRLSTRPNLFFDRSGLIIYRCFLGVCVCIDLHVGFDVVRPVSGGRAPDTIDDDSHHWQHFSGHYLHLDYHSHHLHPNTNCTWPVRQQCRLPSLWIPRAPLRLRHLRADLFPVVLCGPDHSHSHPLSAHATPIMVAFGSWWTR